MSENDTIIGLRISQREYELVGKAVVAIAEEARKHGETQTYAALKRFVVRLKQAVYAGEGVPQSTMDALAAEVDGAFAAHDFQRAQSGISAMLAAVVRMDPDPAHVIAMVLAPVFIQTAQAVAESGHGIAAECMKRFEKRLETEKAAFAATGWSDGEETLDYVRSLALFCAEELDRGVDPFAVDESPERH